MKRFLLTFFSILSVISAESQSGFEFDDGIERVEIPFKSAYNLIILPVKVNGVELNMILDTGASKSIIFNFSGIDSLSVQSGKLLKVNGYGDLDYFEAYYSENNTIELNGYTNHKANLFIAAEKEVNLEPTMGITVHGLLGTDFFQNALIELDYLNQKIIVVKNRSSIDYKLKKMSKIPMIFKDGRPYIFGDVFNGLNNYESELLIDIGSGDALWLFDMNPDFKLNNASFEDYLGIGMNGEIYGTRSKMKRLSIAGFVLEDITVSLPSDQISIYNESNEVNGGSIGGEVLRRFEVIFDYQSSSLYLKPNENLANGFFYNMAGIEINAGEKELFVNIVNTSTTGRVYNREVEGVNTISSVDRYSYNMMPKLYVGYVRPDSPAQIAGIMVGDEIVGVNYKKKGRFSLNDVASRFYKKPYSKVRLKVKRDDKILRFTIKLIPLI